MKIGDILIYKGANSYSYTYNKHYKIYKIDNNFIIGHKCGFIIDDHNSSVYFRENEAEIDGWIYLKKLRKQKIKKLNEKL